MNTDNHLSPQLIECASVSGDGMKDVSIMTMGEASGHGMVVDEKTMDQFMKLALGKSIPAYLTHEGAVDDSGRPSDRLGKEIGMFSGFYRDADRIRASQFQFLDSFKKAEPKVYGTLVELAKNFSDKLGISPVIRHMKAWVMQDGKEAPVKDSSVPANIKGTMPAMRIFDLLSCDFVQKPATNMGLFSAKVDGQNNQEEQNMADTIALSKHNEELTALSIQHKDAVSALETKHKESVAALQAKLDEAVAQKAKVGEEIASLTSALAAKTKEAEDAAKYDMRKAGAQALSVALDTAAGGKIPAPAANSQGRWEQYAALCEPVLDPKTGIVLEHKETPAAKLFKERHLKR